MIDISKEICPECQRVERYLEIDIKRLFNKLKTYKRRKLSDREQLYICLSLLGEEPLDIAKREYFQYLEQQVKSQHPGFTEKEIQQKVNELIRAKASGIKSFITINLSMPLKELLSELDKDIDPEAARLSWAKIVYILKANGYKKEVETIQKRGQRKRIVIDYEGRILLKKVVKILEEFEQYLGDVDLTIEDIEQEDEEHE
ncbi:hypothetical protein [Fischerella sp. NIES-3754]|uniref:hypothetical protein n=1 Tax=Fischerella sp. NIES-3754 TaxID=1752063 RepID=UPI00072289D1|nr:hypothetical protein [Fischerella sp. NIES-3754]BAU04806.1 hypothetical protein FIS3754_06950 [Fischerella sp. NIES-3754]